MQVSFRLIGVKRLLKKIQIRRLSLYPKAARHVVKQAAIYARAQAVRQSSFRRYVIGRGRQTLVSDKYGKRRAGPYSKRRAVDSGPTADHEINIQSGDYVKGWYIRHVRGMMGASGSFAMGLGNRAPHAKYIHTVGGAGWMRERRILKGITESVLRRSLRPNARQLHDMVIR